MTAILPVDIDSEWLVEWCQPRDRAELPPIEAALLDACPVALDFRQYARAAGLGLAGRLASVMFEGVIFDGARFRLAQHCEEQFGAEVAFLLAAENAECEIGDLVAWVPETGRVGTLLGEIGTLGLAILREPRITPPIVHETLLAWLLADDDGLFVLDPKIAARDLERVTISAPDRDAALRLRARLAPHCTRAPKIVVPRMAA